MKTGEPPSAPVSLAGRAPQSTTVKPGSNSSRSTGWGRTRRVCANRACQVASATIRTGMR